jgi:hypothetical protein
MLVARLCRGFVILRFVLANALDPAMVYMVKSIEYSLPSTRYIRIAPGWIKTWYFGVYVDMRVCDVLLYTNFPADFLGAYSYMSW